MTTLEHTLALPTLDGFIFRHFAGDGDYAHMMRVTDAANRADQIDFVDTEERLRNEYAHLENCDPARDMVFAEPEGEADGEVAAYGRVWWADETAGVRRYGHFALVHPRWRHTPLHQTMLRWFEARAREIERANPTTNPVQLEVWAADTQPDQLALFEQEGYEPVRYGYDMTRSLSDQPIPDFALPQGFEIRSVTPEHYRAIWDAGVEAHRDGNDYSEVPADQYERWLNDPLEFQPDLWKVAWNIEKNEVAAMGLNFVNHEENRTFNRKRGYTENISTQRQYRKLGLARALLVESLRMFKAMGMTEAALGVDATNPTGALRVYEACGFRPVRTETEFRKPL